MIPSEFQIYGQVIQTRIENIELNNSGHVAQADYNENAILLATVWERRELADQSVEQNFYHEFVHILLEKSGWQRRLFKDKTEEKEHFVENFSALLHQAIKTFKFDMIVGVTGRNLNQES